MQREELNRALPGSLAVREFQPEQMVDGYRWTVSDRYREDVIGSIDFNHAGQLLKVNCWNGAAKKRMLKAVERYVALKQAFEAGFDAGFDAGGSAEDHDEAFVATWQATWPHLKGSIA